MLPKNVDVKIGKLLFIYTSEQNIVQKSHLIIQVLTVIWNFAYVTVTENAPMMKRTLGYGMALIWDGEGELYDNYTTILTTNLT